ncbi:MAG: hypothetical protein KME45_03000 [Stenomitos rutilans HA7619-LM2]|jgi:hypothetical protein|nr:hypothetical protein [Stenomitos rutilans HA7619-LM2]MBW4469352.1 hypothetical protein [Stenomitos rutilans HA7619-LM2]
MTRTTVPRKSRRKCREPVLDRPFEAIKAQVAAIVAQRPGIDVMRLAVACRLPIVGRRRLGVHTLKAFEQLKVEGVINLVEPCVLYPQMRVFPAGYQPKPRPVDRVYAPYRSWVDPSFKGAPRSDRLPNGRERVSRRAHWDEVNRQRFGEAGHG